MYICHQHAITWWQVLGSLLRGVRNARDVELQERCGLAREVGGSTGDSKGVDHQLRRAGRGFQGVPLRLTCLSVLLLSVFRVETD